MRRLLRYFRNFYVATGVGLLVWMLVFDANDLFSQLRNWWNLRSLEEDKAYYKAEIKRVENQTKQVLGTDQLREKYAREHYLMKKPSEDVYVLVDENNEPIEKQ
ncbi:MAG: septum formation initiator family protein [Cytophagales bacterium]|nr:MAG: septum formation initiator family protein [Cytophagales bacterium]